MRDVGFALRVELPKSDNKTFILCFEELQQVLDEFIKWISIYGLKSKYDL